MRVPILPRRCFLKLAAAAPVVGLGCAVTPGPTLQVGCNLPRWLWEPLDAALREEGLRGQVRWVRLDESWSVERLATPWSDLDVVIGGPLEGLKNLERSGRLRAQLETGLSWLELIGPAVALGTFDLLFEQRALPAPRDWSCLSDRRSAGLVALGDPRRDVWSRAMMETRLQQAPVWTQGYGELVRAAGNALPIAMGPGVAQELVLSGKAGVAAMPTTVAPEPGRLHVELVGPGPGWGAVVLAGPQAEAAWSVLGRLQARGLLEGPRRGLPDSGGLLPVLLGATLVDAQPELARAWAALGVLDQTGPLEGYLTEPPPWPPASVQELREKDEGTALVETLAAAITPALEPRIWLLEQWSQPAGAVDGAVLERIEAAAGGRLAAEPRFRAWLAGEWRVWARQRYRRVRRQAELNRPARKGALA